MRAMVLTALWVVACVGAALAQAPPTILEIDIENWVSYAGDIFDASRFATESTVTTARPPRNFGWTLFIGDIVAVNGRPAKGITLLLGQSIGLTTAPIPGQAIADTFRGGFNQLAFEILQPDGTPIGSIWASGLGGGPPPPGAPLAAVQGNNAIVGGTGAFLGARGQAAGIPRTIARGASMAEDPANRRVHGGGRIRFVMHLIPLFRPEISALPAGPAVTHSTDFSLVTASRPARPGEVLSLFATGLGPTRPGVDPGKPFPASPLAVVTSPVEVTVNGRPADVLAAVGLPGAVDGYQVNFRIPGDTVPGTALIQLSAAWIVGSELRIAVQ